MCNGRLIDLDALDIPEYDVENLDIPFSEEKIWNTIKVLLPDKTPGHDGGFTRRYFSRKFCVFEKHNNKRSCSLFESGRKKRSCYFSFPVRVLSQ